MGLSFPPFPNIYGLLGARQPQTHLNVFHHLPVNREYLANNRSKSRKLAYSCCKAKLLFYIPAPWDRPFPFQAKPRLVCQSCEQHEVGSSTDRKRLGCAALPAWDMAGLYDCSCKESQGKKGCFPTSCAKLQERMYPLPLPWCCLTSKGAGA